MDGWTNVFAAPGTRTLGAMDGRFLLAGPHGATPPKLLGDYGMHDNLRAVVAMVGLGAKQPADATDPWSSTPTARSNHGCRPNRRPRTSAPTGCQ